MIAVVSAEYKVFAQYRFRYITSCEVSNAIQMNSGGVQILPEAMTIDICINFFIKVNQLIIVP